MYSICCACMIDVHSHMCDSDLRIEFQHGEHPDKRPRAQKIECRSAHPQQQTQLNVLYANWPGFMSMTIGSCAQIATWESTDYQTADTQPISACTKLPDGSRVLAILTSESSATHCVRWSKLCWYSWSVIYRHKGPGCAQDMNVWWVRRHLWVSYLGSMPHCVCLRITIV